MQWWEKGIGTFLLGGVLVCILGVGEGTVNTTSIYLMPPHYILKMAKMAPVLWFLH